MKSNTQIIVCRILEMSGKTQIQAARDLGVSIKTVSNWCNGKSSGSLDSIVMLCAIYGVKFNLETA